MTKLVPGSKAPDFTTPLSDGSTFSLARSKGSWVVVYFYPEDGSVGCTTENQEFTALRPAFEKLGATLIGISPDSMDKHHKFAGKSAIGVPLASDPDNKIIEAYGLWGPKKMFGKPYMGVLRETVIVDPKGKVAAIVAATRIKGHAQKVLETLASLTN